jgi:hypothetical protein
VNDDGAHFVERTDDPETNAVDRCTGIERETAVSHANHEPAVVETHHRVFNWSQCADLNDDQSENVSWQRVGGRKPLHGTLRSLRMETDGGNCQGTSGDPGKSIR